MPRLASILLHPMQIKPPVVGGFICLLPFLLASCVSQRLPQGAYIPASSSESPTSSATISAPPSSHRTTSTQAANALGIRSERSDNHRLLESCASYLGTPYKYGGNTREGLDCSGLTSNVYSEVYGIPLHRRSIDQFEKDVPSISTTHLRQGDLVFFTTNSKGTCSHVGIYLKDGRFIHASTKRGVVVDELSDSYYAPRFLGGGSSPKIRTRDAETGLIP